MNKKFIALAIPNLGIGIFWSLLGTAIPWFTYKFTNSPKNVVLIYSIAAISGIIIQLFRTIK